MGIEDETSEVAQFHVRLCLDAETATHVIVTVDETVIVALRTAKEDEVSKDTLLEMRESTDCRHLDDGSRSEGSRLADTIWCQVGTVFHRL